MFRIPSLRSRNNELESDNECLRRIQYELLTTNSILSANIHDLQQEVAHFRLEAELNDERALLTEIELDSAIEELESLRAVHEVVVEELREERVDNVKLLNALREAKARIAQLEYSEPQPDTTESGDLLEIKTVESKAKVERPVFKPSMEEAMKLRNAGQKNMPEEDFMLYLHNRDSRVCWLFPIEKIINGDPDA